MDDVFDPKEYQARKRREKWQAWSALIFGAIVLFDSAAPIPIPLVGLPSIILGLGLLGYGYAQYKSYRALPLHEALRLGKLRDGKLTRTDIFLSLKLTPQQADQVLQVLVSEGFIEPFESGLPPEHELCYRLLS
ncbi:hypothetical protein WDW89_24130 [Deltaproteobacteria bacterium TL4]